MKREQLVVALTACFFFLSLLPPAGAALVTYSLKDRLSAGRPGLRSAPGWLSTHSGTPPAPFQLTGEKSAVRKDPGPGAGVLSRRRTPVRSPKIFPLVKKISFTSMDRAFARQSSTSSGETHVPPMKARKPPKNTPFPGPFFPSPLTESVTLLLLGCGMIALAGLGMKAYRKLLSNH